MISLEKESQLQKRLLVTFNAVASVILLGWIIGLKCAEVVAPENVREDIKALIQCNLNYYKEKN